MARITRLLPGGDASSLCGRAARPDARSCGLGATTQRSERDVALDFDRRRFLDGLGNGLRLGLTLRDRHALRSNGNHDSISFRPKKKNPGYPGVRQTSEPTRQKLSESYA